DNVYIDTNPASGPSVAAGDVRLTECCGCSPNTVVGVCGWCDIGDSFVNPPAPVVPNVDQFLIGYVDINANTVYDLGDPLYLDTSDLGAPVIGAGVVSVNDIRLTGRSDSGVDYAPYSIVQSGDTDTWLQPILLRDTATVLHPVIPSVDPINSYLGFVDTNCDGIWATDGTDKLYLQQIVVALFDLNGDGSNDATVNQFDRFASIGDFRLYMPTDEPCWPDCGTKVEQCDEDAVYGLLIPGVTVTLHGIVPAMQFAFNDVDGNGLFDIGECAYIDTNTGVPLRVDVGDVRLCGCCGMEPNTVVKDCDCDYDTPLTAPAQTIVGYVDINSDGVCDVGDPLYLDTGRVGPNSVGFVSPADIRLTGRGAYKPYSVVQAGDTDVGPGNPLLDPNTGLPLPTVNVINNYLGFIDSDCDSVWDADGDGELYLQQMVVGPVPAELQFNTFSTIGDFRLYIPPGSGGTTYNPYDTNQNCKIEMGELAVAIGDWKAGTLSMGDLATLIGYWKAGSYC
ncbi:hypothetical protein KAT92_05695, partial [Candidatus Babeliales bacterium]|nr:hypothetical protein [Candidatus Babeliales bacterium]